MTRLLDFSITQNCDFGEQILCLTLNPGDVDNLITEFTGVASRRVYPLCNEL